MMRFIESQLFDRILFTLLVVGILLGIYSVYKIVTIQYSLGDNLAQQIRNSNEEREIQSSAEGHSLMTSDIARRRLVNERAQMYVAAGISLVMIGLGWLGYDFRKSRRTQPDIAQSAQG